MGPVRESKKPNSKVFGVRVVVGVDVLAQAPDSTIDTTNVTAKKTNSTLFLIA
jgi:hypothetical protein